MNIYVATFVFIALIVFTLVIQLISNMKIVGGNELGIKSGTSKRKGFSMISGGRMFIIPLINKFAKMDLTPHTIEVVVDSAIAAGVIPLKVKATVSIGVAASTSGRERACTRILPLTRDWEELKSVAGYIIEGHLRDSIATMTPEQVMRDKDILVSKMINVCKSDLENIGLEIITMNIADVDDHRLDGVDEPDLYIALLKRIQSTDAQAKARVAQARSTAEATSQQISREAEIKVRELENELEQLRARTKVTIQELKQDEKIGIEKAIRDAEASKASILAEISSEKENANFLRNKYKAEIITSAEATRDKMILRAEQEAAKITGKAQGEINELKRTIDFVNKNPKGLQTYIIENFRSIVEPFAETLAMFPVDNVSVITGADGKHDPISGIHPHAIDEMRNKLLNENMGAIYADKLKKNNDPDDNNDSGEE
jgi:flotillin